GHLLPSRPLPDPAAPPRGLDPAQVALFPPQAVQASPSAGGLPAKSWGTGMASLASRPQRQGLLAQSPKLPSQRGHDHRLVPRPGPDPLGRTSPCVTNFRKPPWYVERMPGGVGGGNREELAYAISGDDQPPVRLPEGAQRRDSGQGSGAADRG